MQNKICLVTGANAGIGKATCMGLAKQGATVLMISRNPEKGKKAQQEIINQTNNSNVELYLAEFSSQKQVRKVAATIQDNHPTIDVLINNAGMVIDSYQATEEGYELQWGVNHLAPFLLTNLLMPQLKAAKAARIINVSSGAHHRGEINFDFEKPQNYGMAKAYCQSKLANVLFTYELARQLKDTNITVNCLHPGVIKTQIGNNNQKWWLRWGKKIMFSLAKPAEEGAKTSLYLATSPEVEGKSGGYYDESTLSRSSRLSHDEALAKKLWEVSLQQVGLS